MSFGLAKEQLYFDIKLKMIHYAMQVAAWWSCLLDVMQNPSPYNAGLELFRTW